jgi:nitrogen-specific signal transduction histidine kinase
MDLIFKDITMAKGLKSSNSDLSQKTLFLSKSAHELKNPVLCIQELIEQLYDTYLKRNANAKNELEQMASIFNLIPQIKSLSNYILVLVKDLDYFSQKQLGNNVSFEIHETKLEDILGFCKDVAKGLLRKYGKNERIQFSIIKQRGLNNLPEYLQTDEWRLKQLIINLISNSVKFTDQGKIDLEVSYSFISEMPAFRFSVTDTGRGIPKSEQKRLFKPFNKGSTSSNYSGSLKNDNLIGSGLGLNIVYDISKKLGLPIQFTSEPGKGSCFWFTVYNTEKVKSYNSFYVKNFLDTKPNADCNESLMTLKYENLIDDSVTKETQNRSSNILFNNGNGTIGNQTQNHSQNDTSYFLKKDFQTFEIKENKKEEVKENSERRSLGMSISSTKSKVPKKNNRRRESINIQNINIFNSIQSTRHRKFKNEEEEGERQFLKHFINCELFELEYEDENVNYVIVCDDQKVIRQNTIRMLSKISKETNRKICVLEAEDGIECLYLVFKCIKIGIHISFIMSDDIMEFIKGVKSAELLKNMLEHKFPPIPFYLLSGMLYEDDYKKQYSLSISEFLVKPIRQDKVKDIFLTHSS